VILAKPKLVPVLTTFLLLIAIIAFTWIHGYQNGKRIAEEKAAKAIVKYQSEMRDLSKKLRIAEDKRNEALRKEKEVIRNAEDPTGCADTNIPDGILERLR